jgi:epsilon-lactone hydrolase
VTTVLRAREQGLALPAATMPLSPWLDMDAAGETFETNAAKDLIITRDFLQTFAVIFLGEGGNRRDPLANPLYGDLMGLPPMYIQVGADETLLDDSRKLADLARQSGVEVTLDIVPEMQHVFQFLAGTAPEGDAAIRRLADWVRPKLGLG